MKKFWYNDGNELTVFIPNGSVRFMYKSYDNDEPYYRFSVVFCCRWWEWKGLAWKIANWIDWHPNKLGLSTCSNAIVWGFTLKG